MSDSIIEATAISAAVLAESPDDAPPAKRPRVEPFTVNVATPHGRASLGEQLQQLESPIEEAGRRNFTSYITAQHFFIPNSGPQTPFCY